jgi:hypothetical protein
MKTILKLSLSILLIWYIITRLEPRDGFRILDENTMNELHRNALIQQILWGVMILLQSILCYRLYTLRPLLTGNFKSVITIYLGVIICLLIVSVIIVFVDLTSFWF